MSISENIAKYRKKNGFTQEQLGVILGVSNQAVSKWESAVSMPDVMLLPKLSLALGITLEELYGIEKKKKELMFQNQNIIVNDFAKDSQKLIRNNLYQQIFDYTENLKHIVKYETNEQNEAHINSNYNIGIISYNVDSAAFVSENLSVISSNIDIQNGARIFDKHEIASGMKKLCDPYVRKILRFLYSEAFTETLNDLEYIAEFFITHDIFRHEFLIKDVSDACELTLDEALDAVEKLISLHIVSTEENTDKTLYFFEKTRGVEALVTFQVIESLIRGEFNWGSGYIVGHGVL